MFPGIRFWNLPILLADRPCLGLFSSKFQDLLFLQDKFLESVWSYQCNCSKQFFKIIGLALSRINSAIISAQTVVSCVPAAHIYRSLEALRAEKSLKKVSFWPSGPESQKSPEKVEKSPKSLQKVPFWGLFDLFGTFLRLWAGRPRKTFLRLFRGFRPGGPRDSCRCGRQGR